ncbi:diacylglycerol kinase theta [Gouania willdenowi]|uniref:Diacylglycerol kinase n=1 Tax=Gouania willdenowi TaxID=441366 RepID=A0A8C5DK97_GOUWI|nr:diacylglycerol kinase theta [Gouania willdenowi]
MADLEAADSRSQSPQSGKKRTQQSPGLRPRYQSSAPGHCFRKVTLTKPTFCHSCSDFIWGLIGFLCEVCNLMCHEKCLKTLRIVCSCVTPALITVPVAHCLSPAGHKRHFCSVCRKQTEGNSALRCEVCELHVHADCAAFTCADCRCSNLDGTLLQLQEPFHHHWREGNLPSAARCHICRRSCASSDALAGMRCEWCSVTTHTACHSRVSAECSLGHLCSMMLPPTAVRLQSRKFSKTHCYRITENYTQDLADNADDVDSSTVTTKDVQPTVTDSAKQLLRVFDGDDAVKRGFFRLVSICRATRNEDVVGAALRAFYLPDEPQLFELQEVGGGRLQHLHSDDVQNRNGASDTRGDAWILRNKHTHPEVIEVHAAWSRSSVSVSVTESSTAASVLSEVLSRLDSQGEDESNFSLLEVYMSSKQVQRQTLTPQEKILEKLQEIRKVSLRQMNQTRFYAVENRKCTVQVELLIGGFPPLLNADEYVQIINEQLDIKSHLASISHMYSCQGAVSLQVSCFSEAERIFMLAKDTSVSNKTLNAVVVPEILHTELGVDVVPLLVFVNPRSGGLKGKELLHSFRKLLNPHQVFDICNGGPLAGLHSFRNVPRFRVLVCGGDGTVGWVLGVLEAIRHKLVCHEPPIGIVPLGTGNDLARVLRWGAGYSGDDPHHILVSVDEADEVLMDRWTILLDAQDLSEDGKDNNFLEPPKIVQMNNYFGIGIDAELSLDFHLAREDEPDKFTSRFHNKSMYVKVGLQKISHSRCLNRELQLQVDTHNVPLPNIEGLIFLNIPSWGSGADLWGSEVDGRYGKPRIDDGLLEVVGVTGVVHMGQVQGGLRSGIRIAQGNYIRLTVSKHVHVQVDGEPWIQPPGHVIISAAGPKVRMLRRSKQKQKKTVVSV